MLYTTGQLLWKLLRISAGFVLIIGGLILSLPGIPGPGLLLVVLGLGILGQHFHWAHRINVYMKEKWHEFRNRGKATTTQQETHHG
jgi:hypothetical protein